MNKLKYFCLGGACIVSLVTSWAMVHYGPQSAILFAGIFGLGSTALPSVLSRMKYYVTRIYSRYLSSGPRHGPGEGTIFVSTSPVEDAFEYLEAAYTAIDRDDTYESVTREEFSEGPGLSVIYAGFHNSFVRVSNTGMVVVTGASERSIDVVDTLRGIKDIRFEQTNRSPFVGYTPIRGAARVFLSVFVAIALMSSIVMIGGGAYPNDAYNPAERTVLMGIDAHGDLNPRVSATDTTLTRVAFLVSIVEEESTEIGWAQNKTTEIERHSQQALAVSQEARELLGSVASSDPTTAQREQIKSLRVQLTSAEAAVVTAVDEKTRSENVTSTTTIDETTRELAEE
ncbi:MAG: hypothetical protein J07HQX50_01083 [Haloquadratum sp. J07HQX50]|nr:MAG: hypothetical protein J07HQX50_01083 [Haloquadratum sp. J07HQX50]